MKKMSYIQQNKRWNNDADDDEDNDNNSNTTIGRFHQARNSSTFAIEDSQSVATL